MNKKKIIIISIFIIILMVTMIFYKVIKQSKNNNSSNLITSFEADLDVVLFKNTVLKNGDVITFSIKEDMIDGKVILKDDDDIIISSGIFSTDVDLKTPAYLEKNDEFTIYIDDIVIGSGTVTKIIKK